MKVSVDVEEVVEVVVVMVVVEVVVVVGEVTVKERVAVDETVVVRVVRAVEAVEMVVNLMGRHLHATSIMNAGWLRKLSRVISLQPGGGAAAISRSRRANEPGVVATAVVVVKDVETEVDTEVITAVEVLLLCGGSRR